MSIYRVTLNKETCTATASEFNLVKGHLNRYFKPIRKSGSIKELDNIITFDTETTSEYELDENGKPDINKPIRGYINCWSMTIDGTTFKGDTVRDFLYMLDYMKKIVKKANFKMTAGNGKNVKNDDEELEQPMMRIYIHNLGYDYTYLKLFLDGCIPFGGTRTEPINVTCDNKIKFFDSLKLFDKSLESLIEEYGVDYNADYKCNWDYSKIRKPGDPLTPEELFYVSADTAALHDIIKKKVESNYNGNLHQVPATKTGELRVAIEKVNEKVSACEHNEYRFNKYFSNMGKIVKNENCLPDLPKTKKEFSKMTKCIFLLKNTHEVVKITQKRYKNEWYYKELSQYAYDSLLLWGAKHKMGLETYRQALLMSQDAFAGGFTHANRHKLGCILENVLSGDERSAYPAATFYPWFGLCYKKTKLNSIDEIKKGKTYMFYATFTNLRTINNGDGYFTTLSKHKAILYNQFDNKEYECSNIKTDNGRVFTADKITFCLYSRELLELQNIYKWDDITFDSVLVAEEEYLPRSILLVTSKYFGDKTTLKEKLKDLENKLKKDPDNIELKKEFELTKVIQIFTKQQLNSIYGCLATNPLKYIVEDDYLKEDGTVDTEEYLKAKEEAIKRLFNKKNTVIDFIIGPQVTMINRCIIYKFISQLGPKYCIYSDTDSVKFEKSCPNYQTKMDELNNFITNIMVDSVKANEIGIETWKEKNEIFYPGILEVDGDYQLFKTVGAKSYAFLKVDETEIHSVVAGIRPEDMTNYLYDRELDHVEKYEDNGEIKEKNIYRPIHPNKPITTPKGALRRLNTCINIDEQHSGKRVHRYYEFNKTTKWNDGVETGCWISIYDTTFEKSVCNDVIRCMKRNMKIYQAAIDHLIDD